MFNLAAFISAQNINDISRIHADTAGGPQPWNNLDFNNDPDNFQFAIIPDYTGGHRPGIMEDVIRKLNILQPEFVITTGDMIEGYTTNETEIYQQWSDYKGLIKDLKMPVFYIPGNHDYSNEVMSRIWNELFGSSYYQFIYKNVLFLCLNTEESLKGADQASIEEQQFNFVRKTLMDHPDVRWTFILMHHPLWLYDKTGYWDEIELLLKDRKHTVIAGHNHQYVKYERNNGKYFILATAGGVSQLRGPNFGEFDHITVVNMTDDGPVLANLLLQGIWDENVVTEELNNMIHSRNIMIEPVFIEDPVFNQTEFIIKITNGYDYPMWTYLTFDENPILKPEILSYQKEIKANTTETVKLPVNTLAPVDINRIQPLRMNTWSVYKYKNNREIQVDSKYGIAPVKKKYCIFSNGKIWIDGVLDEWEGLAYKVDAKSARTGDIQKYFGDYDGSFEFDVRYDLENLYIAMSVWDDQVILNENASLWAQDVVRIYLDARPLEISANGKGENQSDDYLFISLAPAAGKKANVNIYQKERLPQNTVIATKKTLAGFDVEIAIPLTYIELKNKTDWENFRINFAFIDVDENNSRTTIWWQPEWDSEANFIGSGMFFKQSK
jgi:predicted phosphodiesterase